VAPNVVTPPANPGTGAAAGPPKCAVTADGPVGLYFMTRSWFGGGLEKGVWYFAPDGTVYDGLRTGFSAADLAAHRGPKGRRTYDGATMKIVWADGKSQDTPLERDNSPDCFMWEMGSFTPAEPFRDRASLVGKYDGGESVSHGGNTAATAQTLELNADGTFTWSRVGRVAGGPYLEAGATGTTTGTWSFDNYSLTLAGGGQTIRRIAFPYDDPDTPVKPDRILFDGIMFKKLLN
jgi:hypothetical protein